MGNESESESVSRPLAIARGRTLKRANALTALLCGGVPAAILALKFPSTPAKFLAGFFVGLLWANAFEYVYHRFLLHTPGNFTSRGHLEHHASVGTPFEAEHVNLGGSPLWVVLLFVLNSAPVIAADLLLRLGAAPGILVGFAVYLILVEEVHWRIHVGGWLPPGLRAARAYHLAHHDRPDSRYNIFLPLFDRIFRHPTG
jgi:Fatty acid hydroxylase superfamily